MCQMSEFFSQRLKDGENSLISLEILPMLPFCFEIKVVGKLIKETEYKPLH